MISTRGQREEINKIVYAHTGHRLTSEVCDLLVMKMLEFADVLTPAEARLHAKLVKLQDAANRPLTVREILHELEMNSFSELHRKLSSMYNKGRVVKINRSYYAYGPSGDDLPSGSDPSGS